MTYYRSYYLGFGLGVTLLGLVTFLILHLLQVPAGNLIDWLIGVAIFWWLLTLVTIPWNIYFTAKEVIDEARISQEKNIQFDPSYLTYVRKVSKGSLLIAIGLHLVSAIALYSLAFFQVTPLGYISSVATLLLTGLRPAIRAYQYLFARLSMIRQSIKYPREDVLTLQNTVDKLIGQVKSVEDKLNLNDPNSWIVQQQIKWQEVQQEVYGLRQILEDFKKRNKIDHQQIIQQNQQAIAQFTEDSQFLAQVREIIRFFKTA